MNIKSLSVSVKTYDIRLSETSNVCLKMGYRAVALSLNPAKHVCMEGGWVWLTLDTPARGLCPRCGQQVLPRQHTGWGLLCTLMAYCCVLLYALMFDQTIFVYNANKIDIICWGLVRGHLQSYNMSKILTRTIWNIWLCCFKLFSDTFH